MSEGYTMLWHDKHAAVWESVVLPVLPSGPRRWLELGSYEGKSAEWTLQHAIRKGDELVCVDLWRNADVEKRFDQNVRLHVTAFKESHESFLLRQIRDGRTFDVIYVDGDHNAPAVLSDCVLGWKVLRPNGVMIFDDYRWAGFEFRPRAIAPCVAIDGFLASHATQLRVLHKGYQVIVQRLSETVVKNER